MKTITKLIVFVCALTVLTACGSRWVVEVDLTPEERKNIERAITDWQHQIEAFEIDETGEIAWRQIISLAGEYEKLGRLDKAIALYKEWLDQGYKTQAMLNNLGRLYEKVEEYDLAIEQYQRIVDEYLNKNYYYDITWAYIRAKERIKAEKAFNKWQLAMHKTDEQIQQAIKKLREEESQQ